MTNGVIVALGDVGRNVAAGMSGGILYLYSEAGHRRDEKTPPGWRDKNGGLPAVIPSKDGCLEAEFNGVLLWICLFFLLLGVNVQSEMAPDRTFRCSMFLMCLMDGW